jgi:hypothetical protein
MNEEELTLTSAEPTSEEVAPTPEAAEPTPDPLAVLTAEKEALGAQIAQLRAQNEALRAEWEQERTARAEREEFCALYPDVDLRSLPEEVLSHSTLPLAAAYALYARRCALADERAAQANLQNAQKSSGRAHHDGESDGEYSLDEIRRMTPRQVRTRYQTILHSLKKSR